MKQKISLCQCVTLHLHLEYQVHSVGFLMEGFRGSDKRGQFTAMNKDTQHVVQEERLHRLRPFSLEKRLGMDVKEVYETLSGFLTVGMDY